MEKWLIKARIRLAPGAYFSNLRTARCRITEFMSATGAIRVLSFDGPQGGKGGKDGSPPLVLAAIIIIEFPFDSHLPPYTSNRRIKEESPDPLCLCRQ